MNIKSISEPHITYYVETDHPNFPKYRTDETGENWENYLSGIWQPVFWDHDKELKEMFSEFMNKKTL